MVPSEHFEGTAPSFNGPDAGQTSPVVLTVDGVIMPLNYEDPAGIASETVPVAGSARPGSGLLHPEECRACEAVLGYTFRDPCLLELALTHASLARTRLESNERMEFLGDSIMGTVVCEYLFQKFPDYPEGELTRIKSAVVSRHTCAKISTQKKLDDFLLLGKGLTIYEQVPSSIMAAVFESLVAAIYLDGGWDAARKFLLDNLTSEIDRVAESTHGHNFKSQLQQSAQKIFSVTPVYRMLDEKGPDHSKCFQVAAVIGTTLYPPAWGPSKKEAEQLAARNAIEQLQSQSASE